MRKLKMNLLDQISSFFNKNDLVGKNESNDSSSTSNSVSRQNISCPNNGSNQHVLDFSETPSKLTTTNEQLLIEQEGKPPVSIPYSEIAVIIISHNQVSLAQSVMQNLAENGCMLTICDRKYRPVCMMLPLDSHSLPSQRLQIQIEASLPQKKNAWQQIIRAKIKSQAKLLLASREEDHGLLAMAERVKSGDPENVEAHAARRYWQYLFDGDVEFRRQQDGNDPLNIRLNYGYAVLRSIVARAVCATGFHPAIGLHHHNKYNPFCLADDLMEPFRPQVDRLVCIQYIRSKIKHKKLSRALTTEVKKELIEPLTGRFDVDGENRKLFDVISTTAHSLVRFFAKEIDSLYLPIIDDLPK
ncbi:MAG: type II CRISPR-associated endonuclease Cas1 [Planctomycetaceae bacterium]|nr:type II CRISPR-associated endonuclease Cas1 [Planctomycetaceae bacterium]